MYTVSLGCCLLACVGIAHSLVIGRAKRSDIFDSSAAFGKRGHESKFLDTSAGFGKRGDSSFLDASAGFGKRSDFMDASAGFGKRAYKSLFDSSAGFGKRSNKQEGIVASHCVLQWKHTLWKLPLDSENAATPPLWMLPPDSAKEEMMVFSWIRRLPWDKCPSSCENNYEM